MKKNDALHNILLLESKLIKLEIKNSVLWS